MSGSISSLCLRQAGGYSRSRRGWTGFHDGEDAPRSIRGICRCSFAVRGARIGGRHRRTSDVRAALLDPVLILDSAIFLTAKLSSAPEVHAAS